MSKKKRLITLTNGINTALAFGPYKEPAFIKKNNDPQSVDWWHIELANSDYCGVHEEHGRALAKDAIRYMRENDAPHVLWCATEAMLRKNPNHLEEEVIRGFMAVIGEVLCSVKKVNLYQ